MALRRRTPPPPCPCGCAELAQRLADAEALNTAIIRAVVALRPRRACDTIAQGLAGWGVPEADARRLAQALATRT